MIEDDRWYLDNPRSPGYDPGARHPEYPLESIGAVLAIGCAVLAAVLHATNTLSDKQLTGVMTVAAVAAPLLVAVVGSTVTLTHRQVSRLIGRPFDPSTVEGHRDI